MGTVRESRETAIRAYVESAIASTGTVPTLRAVLDAVGGKSAIACGILREYRAATAEDIRRPREGWESERP